MKFLFIILLLGLSSHVYCQFRIITEPEYIRLWHLHVGPDIAPKNDNFWGKVTGYPIENNTLGTIDVSLIHLRNRHFFNIKTGFYSEKAESDSISTINKTWMFGANYGYNLFIFHEVMISAFAGLRTNLDVLKSSPKSVDNLADYLALGETHLAINPWAINLGINVLIFNAAGRFSSEVYTAYTFNINETLNVTSPRYGALTKTGNPMKNFVLGIKAGIHF